MSDETRKCYPCNGRGYILSNLCAVCGGEGVVASSPRREPMGERRSAEQEARDMLHRAGVEAAWSYTAGDVVEIANLIAEVTRLRAEAALGRALLAALATLTPGFNLLIDCPRREDDEPREVYVASPSYAIRQNDATRALADALRAAALSPTMEEQRP